MSTWNPQYPLGVKGVTSERRDTVIARDLARPWPMTMQILMVQVDDLMTFLILLCCDHDLLHQSLIVQIDTFMKFILVHWFDRHFWMVQHMTFMRFLLLVLPIRHGAL